MFAASLPMGNLSWEVTGHQCKVTGLARAEADVTLAV